MATGPAGPLQQHGWFTKQLVSQHKQLTMRTLRCRCEGSPAENGKNKVREREGGGQRLGRRRWFTSLSLSLLSLSIDEEELRRRRSGSLSASIFPHAFPPRGTGTLIPTFLRPQSLHTPTSLITQRDKGKLPAALEFVHRGPIISFCKVPSHNPGPLFSPCDFESGVFSTVRTRLMLWVACSICYEPAYCV